MRKSVFANDDPLLLRDRETLPGRGSKDSSFQQRDFQKKLLPYPVMPRDP